MNCELREVRVLRGERWEPCRLGEVRKGETFRLLEQGIVVVEATAVEDGQYSEKCGGTILADHLLN